VDNPNTGYTNSNYTGTSEYYKPEIVMSF
jgi:hypothetical protein